MMKTYPCARYQQHMEWLNAQLSAGDPPIRCDSSFCTFAKNLSPVAVDVPVADEQFWSCPCAVAHAQRDKTQHEKALWDTAKNNPEHLIRVQALSELADRLPIDARKP